MINENVLKEKSADFALRIVRLYKYLSEEMKEKVMSNQLLRSGTSIGANVAESIYAASKADFINKLFISQKEAGETKFWLDLLYRAEYINEPMYKSIVKDCEEILKIIGSSLITAKGNK